MPTGVDRIAICYRSTAFACSADSSADRCAIACAIACADEEPYRPAIFGAYGRAQCLSVGTADSSAYGGTDAATYTGADRHADRTADCRSNGAANRHPLERTDQLAVGLADAGADRCAQCFAHGLADGGADHQAADHRQAIVCPVDHADRGAVCRPDGDAEQQAIGRADASAF
jgi:hypothetical protein